MLYFPLFWQLRTARSAKGLTAAVNSEVLFNSTASSWITSLIVWMGTFSSYKTLEKPFMGWALLCCAMNLPSVCVEQYQQRNLSWVTLHINNDFSPIWSWWSAEATWIAFPWISVCRIHLSSGAEQVNPDLLWRGDNYVVKYAVNSQQAKHLRVKSTCCLSTELWCLFSVAMQ